MCILKRCLDRIKNHMQDEQFISPHAFEEYSATFLDALGYTRDMWSLNFDNDKYGIKIKTRYFSEAIEMRRLKKR